MKKIDRVQLASLPTPVNYLKNISEDIGKGKLYIKRDDLTGLGGGGNKIRKLEFLAADALARGCTTLMTVGGPQTNHGRLTAAAAAKLGMKSIILATGTVPDQITGNIILDGLFDCDYRILNSEDPLEMVKAERRIIAEYEKRGEKVYYIPMGGSNPLGVLGYFYCIKEIIDQCAEKDIQIDHLIASYGSSGTYAGLWLGAKYFQAPFDIIGITVSPGLEEKKQTLSDLMKDTNELFDMAIDLSDPDVRIIDSYRGEGYNIPDEKTRNTIKYLASREGLIVDPVYSGKGFRGCLDLMTRGEFSDSDNILFLHTGGSPALSVTEHLKGFQHDLGADYIKEVHID